MQVFDSLSLLLFVCLANLQKFFSSSSAYIVQRVHFQIRVGVFNCQQILISFVVFCAEMLAAAIFTNAERLVTSCVPL